MTPEEAKAHPLYGVKNWLAVFAFGVLLGPLREVADINGEAQKLGMTLGQLLNADASLKTWGTLALATEVAAAVAVLGLMLTKSPHFRVATSAVLIASFPALTLLAFSTGAPGSVATGLVFGFFSWIFSCLVWVTYLQRSRRVRVTFEHCVLASDVRSGVSAAPEPSSRRVDIASPLPTASGLPSPNVVAKPDALAPAPLLGEHDTAQTAISGDEALWAQAFEEVNGAGRRQGLWAKAFAQASGNEPAAKAQYLSERVRQLSEEHAAGNRSDAERLADHRRSDERALREIAGLASALRAAFVSGKRLSPEDVSQLVKASDSDPSLVMLTDRFRGETLLHWSARHSLRDEAVRLLGMGSNADAPNGDGRRPHEVAEDLELRGLLRSAASGTPAA